MEVILALARADGADQLLDFVKDSKHLWQPTHAPLWLRAKLRRDDRNWIAELAALEQDFQALGPSFDLRRYLDRLLDDLPGLPDLALSIERYMTGGLIHREELFPAGFYGFGNDRPWFFAALFDGDPALIRLELGATYQLRRRRRYGSHDEELTLHSLGPERPVLRFDFWRKIAPLHTAPPEPNNAAHDKLTSDVEHSMARFR